MKVNDPLAGSQVPDPVLYFETKMKEPSMKGIEKIAGEEVQKTKLWIQLYKQCIAHDGKDGNKDDAQTYGRLIVLQTDLLEAIARASETQSHAIELEAKVEDLRHEVEIQKSAYEFLVDQILASGLVSDWVLP